MKINRLNLDAVSLSSHGRVEVMDAELQAVLESGSLTAGGNIIANSASCNGSSNSRCRNEKECYDSANTYCNNTGGKCGPSSEYIIND